MGTQHKPLRLHIPARPGHVAGGPGSERPIVAGPGRRLVHSVIAVVGWGVFVYWWILVFSRVRPEEIRFTLFLLGASLVICVGLTVAWTVHNLGIFRRKGARTQVREPQADWSRDRLGRSIAFKGTPEQLQSDPVVQIRIEHEGKVYRPSSTLIARGSGGVIPEKRTDVAS